MPGGLLVIGGELCGKNFEIASFALPVSFSAEAHFFSGMPAFYTQIW
jgi:hypothetical protein